MCVNIRDANVLSRRDEIKVARHEMPGNAASIKPSRRVRYDRSVRVSVCLWTRTKLASSGHTVPYGTDQVCSFPRHFMPGYLHFRPSGTKIWRPFIDVHRQQAHERCTLCALVLLVPEPWAKCTRSLG